MTTRVKRVVVLGAALLVALTGMFIASSNASTPVSGQPLWRIVFVGDTWTTIANDIAPTASSTDKTTFAGALACDNPVDANCHDDSLTTAIANYGWRIKYWPDQVPGPAPTTTAAPTTTGATTTTTPGTTTTVPAGAPIALIGNTIQARGATGTATAPSISCSAGQILTAYVVADNDSGQTQDATVTNSGTALTWHLVGKANAASYAGLFWANCNTTSHTITATMSFPKPVVIIVNKWSNADATNPFPAESVKTGRTSTNPLNVSYVSTKAGSRGLGAGMDWWNSNALTSTDSHVSVGVTAPNADGIAIWKSSNSGAIGTTVNGNFSQTPSMDLGYVWAEMVPAGGGGGGTTTTTAPSGTGFFTTSGYHVYNPQGVEFKPKGINAGTDMVDYYPPTNAYTQGGALMVVQAGHLQDHSSDMLTYGLNMVRLNVQDGLNVSLAISRIQGVIDAYTSKHIVVLVDPHIDFGGAPSYSAWSASWAPNVLGPIIDANKNNPYVWVEPSNEEWQSSLNTTGWVDYHVGFYNWVRSIHSAPNTMVVADALNYGQDISETSVYSDLITGRTNQVIAWHNYGGQSQSSDGDYHDATDSTRTAWMNAAQTAGVPIEIHEFGQSWDPTSHVDHTYPGSDANERAAVSWIMANWTTYSGMGGLAWHGTGANDDFNVRAMTATGFQGAWYDTSVSLSDWGTTFFAKTGSAV
jgi:hypothetical protein